MQPVFVIPKPTKQCVPVRISCDILIQLCLLVLLIFGSLRGLERFTSFSQECSPFRTRVNNS